METKIRACELCGEQMPDGEEMFKFHGFSGPCPKPPLPRPRPLEYAVSEASDLLNKTFEELDPENERDAWFIVRLTKIKEALADHR